MDEQTSRREFFKRLSLFVGAWTGGAAIAGCLRWRSGPRAPTPAGLPSSPLSVGTAERHLAAANAPQPAGNGLSRVVLAEHSGLTDEAWQVQRDVLERVLDDAVITLTGESSAARAWASLFSSDERVGLKPNGLGGPRLSTSADLVLAVIDRLTGIGVKAENIIVWDQDDGKIQSVGLPVQPNGPGFRCYSIGGDLDGPMTSGKYQGRLTNIVTRRVDAIVNLPIFKDHDTAGISLAMKNHYGTIDNPGAHHGNNCDPYIADLNAIPAIRQKTRVIICDATRGCYNGGPGANPQFMWRPNALLASRDPVAHDTIGWQIVEVMRAQNGLPSLTQAGRPPRWIHSAAERGLGTDDPGRIELVRRTLG